YRRARAAPAAARMTASWRLPPFSSHALDLLSQGLKIVVTPRALGYERRHHLFQRSAEEGVQVLLQRGPLRDGRRDRGRVEVPLAFQEALLLEPRQHHAH